MEPASWPDWIEAIATAIAVPAAFGALIFTGVANSRERERDRKRDELLDDERHERDLDEQAAQARAVVPFVVASNAGGRRWDRTVYIENSSKLPIFDVEYRIPTITEPGQRRSDVRGVLTSGSVWIESTPTEDMPHGYDAEHLLNDVTIYFRDAFGRSWKRDNYGNYGQRC